MNQLPNELLKAHLTQQYEANEILLESGSANLEFNGGIIEGTGRLIIRTVPRPKILLITEHGIQRGKLKISDLFLNRAALKQVVFNEHELFVEPHNLLLEGKDMTLHSEFSCFTNTIEYSSEDEMDAVIFHLFNMPLIGGGNNYLYTSLNKTSTIHQYEFEYSGWLIILQAIDHGANVIDDIKKDSGFRLTYIGKLKKSNGSSFDSKEALGIIERFGLYITFMLGMECLPIYLVGSKNGNICWKFINAAGELYAERECVTDHSECQIVTDAYGLFMKMVEDIKIERLIVEIVESYVVSNRLVEDLPFGILLAQSTLEKLSYLYLNKSAGYSKKRLNAFSGKQIIDLLLTKMQIDKSIDYYNQNELKNYAERKRKTNIIEAITSIRNQITHVNGIYLDSQEERLYYEVMNVFLWLVEVGLLKLIKYKGKYANRLNYRKRPSQLDELP